VKKDIQYLSVLLVRRQLAGRNNQVESELPPYAKLSNALPDIKSPPKHDPKAPLDDIRSCTVRPSVVKHLATSRTVSAAQADLGTRPDRSLFGHPTKPRKSSLTFKQLCFLFKKGFLMLFQKIPRGFISLFTVGKANGMSRPIANPEVNSRMGVPWKTRFPSPLQILQVAFSTTHAMTLDFKSFFCQIPLQHHVRGFFTTVMHGMQMAITFLPQGWKCSPFLANQISLIMLGPLKQASV